MLQTISALPCLSLISNCLWRWARKSLTDQFKYTVLFIIKFELNRKLYRWLSDKILAEIRSTNQTQDFRPNPHWKAMCILTFFACKFIDKFYLIYMYCKGIFKLCIIQCSLLISMLHLKWMLLDEVAWIIISHSGLFPTKSNTLRPFIPVTSIRDSTHTWLSFIVELLTNLPSNSDRIYRIPASLQEL
jgi:hypothetical protein